MCLFQVTDVFSGSDETLGLELFQFVFINQTIQTNLFRLLSYFYFHCFCLFYISPQESSVSPALGLAWANQVTVRLMMRRLKRMVFRGDQSSVLRRLEVVFAPHLPQDGRDAGIWKEGVQGVRT